MSTDTFLGGVLYTILLVLALTLSAHFYARSRPGTTYRVVWFAITIIAAVKLGAWLVLEWS